MEIHMMTTSMLTTCRCVLTLSASVIASEVNNITAHSFASCPWCSNCSTFVHIESERKLNGTDVSCPVMMFFVLQGYNSRKEYIASQGPLPVTVSDFWRMIWEKNVQTLVMLTRCNEQGRVSTDTNLYIHTCAEAQQCPWIQSPNCTPS